MYHAWSHPSELIFVLQKPSTATAMLILGQSLMAAAGGRSRYVSIGEKRSLRHFASKELWFLCDRIVYGNANFFSLFLGAVTTLQTKAIGLFG